MRLVRFWARNFRSLREIELPDIGGVSVFYGPNGSGKSNVLQAMRLLYRLTGLRFAAGKLGDPTTGIGSERLLGLVGHDDVWQRDTGDTVVLGGVLRGDGAAPLYSGPRLRFGELEVELRFDYRVQGLMWFSRLTARATDGASLDLLAEATAPTPLAPSLRGPQAGAAVRSDVIYPDLYQFMVREIPREFSLVDGVRGLRFEERSETADFGLRPAPHEVVDFLLDANRLKEALARARGSSDERIRAGFRRMVRILEADLHRPTLDVIDDPIAGRYELREAREAPDGRQYTIPLEQAGLGLVQVYAILAGALLRGADAVAIEEPEAHLHAPDSGRLLRAALGRLVESRAVSQLFIATHSNLFDLDPGGFYEVRLEGGETRIVRQCDRTLIDRYLYEPGPARRALDGFLQFLPPETVVFRRGDGRPVSVEQMRSMLLDDDDGAVAFLEDVHAAAVRVVRAKTHRSTGPT